MPTTIGDVREFLAQKRIALVGLSRNPKDFSRMLFREMCQRGYDMVPVNPAAEEIEGRRCFGRIQDAEPPVRAALVMTPARDSERVVRECAEARVLRVWLYRGGGQGAVTQEAADFCRTSGIRLVEGHCPFMFFEKTGLIHRIHGWILKLQHRYPLETRHC